MLMDYYDLARSYRGSWPITNGLSPLAFTLPPSVYPLTRLGMLTMSKTAHYGCELHSLKANRWQRQELVETI